jgi:hypothetical protein
MVTNLSKIWVGDLGSGKTLSRIPNPRIKKASTLITNLIEIYIVKLLGPDPPIFIPYVNDQ